VEEIHLSEEKVVPAVCSDEVWVLDTGASNHMTGTKSTLTQLDDTVSGSVKFGDGSTVKICGLGSVVMKTRQGDHKVLTSVYYIPQLKSNIISLGQLEEAGCDIRLFAGRLKVFDPEYNLLVSAPRTGNRLYTVQLSVIPPVCLLSKLNDAAWLWHSRFGHLNFKALRNLGVKGMVEGMPIVDRLEQVCDACTLGKQHRAPFPKTSLYRAKRGLELFHADLCGQIRPQTVGGNLYFLLVVDDFSRFMWIELLKTKGEALSCLIKIKQRAEVELESKLKALRTDRGGEFNSRMFTTFCTEQGIKHFTTTPYTPQQNGVVERRNQSVVEMARCLLKGRSVPPRFWGEAVTTAVYLLNRSPTKSVTGMTPYEAWYGKKPYVSHLKTFGCVGHVKKVGPGIEKLSDRSARMVMVRYEPGSKGYRMYDPSTNKLVINRDVKFEEGMGWNWGELEDSQNTQLPDENSETTVFQFQFNAPDEAIQDPTTSDQVGENSGGGGESSATSLTTDSTGAAFNISFRFSCKQPSKL
jgi:hypothetical protein